MSHHYPQTILVCLSALHGLEYVTAIEVHFSFLQPFTHGLLNCPVIPQCWPLMRPCDVFRSHAGSSPKGWILNSRQDGRTQSSELFQFSQMSSVQHEDVFYHVDEWFHFTQVHITVSVSVWNCELHWTFSFLAGNQPVRTHRHPRKLFHTSSRRWYRSGFLLL